MIHTPIIPNGQIILIHPAMTDLQVMILRYELQEPVFQMVGFFGCETVDLVYVVTDSVNGFPARYLGVARGLVLGFFAYWW